MDLLHTWSGSEYPTLHRAPTTQADLTLHWTRRRWQTDQTAASYGIDGNINTRFESEHGGNYELTYTIDLGADYSVSQIAIKWEAETTTATKFKIEVATSENGPWTKVYEKNGGAPEQTFSTSFNPDTARFVKLTATEKTGPWGYSFWEFEVYGTPVQDPNTYTNVALGKTAATNRPGNGPASYGIDGNINTRFESEHGEIMNLLIRLILEEHTWLIRSLFCGKPVQLPQNLKLKQLQAQRPWVTVYNKNMAILLWILKHHLQLHKPATLDLQLMKKPVPGATPSGNLKFMEDE